MARDDEFTFGEDAMGGDDSLELDDDAAGGELDDDDM
jgi:hypothetical protein